MRTMNDLSILTRVYGKGRDVAQGRITRSKIVEEDLNSKIADRGRGRRATAPGPPSAPIRSLPAAGDPISAPAWVSSAMSCLRRSGSRRVFGETLTAIGISMPSRCQWLICFQAAANTQSVRGLMSPVCSACGNEVLRRHHSALGMRPTYQGLHAADRARSYIDLWLVIEQGVRRL